MGGRNNKLCEQRGQDPKGGQAGKETHQKNPAACQKDHFNVYGRQKNKSKKKRKTILNYKFKLLLNFGIGVSSVITAWPIVDNWLLVFIEAT